MSGEPSYCTMESYWFGDVEGRACDPAPGDPGLLAERIELLAGSGDACIPDWRPGAVRSGTGLNIWNGCGKLLSFLLKKIWDEPSWPNTRDSSRWYGCSINSMRSSIS